MAGSMDILPDGVLDVGDKSKINIAYVYLLFNIQFILEKINDSHLSSDFIRWRTLLDRLYINASPMFSAKEREEQKNKIKDVNIAFEKVLSNRDCVGRESQIRKALGEYEMFIREVCSKHDMLMPKTDSRWTM